MTPSNSSTTTISSLLASEIECSVFEDHVSPSLERHSISGLLVPINTTEIVVSSPQVTLEIVEAAIASEHYFSAAHGCIGNIDENPTETTLNRLDMLIICVLVTRGGHLVTGEAYCADPAKFSAETGRTEARKDAISKLWPMGVYAERDRLAAPPSIALTTTEVQSGYDRVRWAEKLIQQLPDNHDGRNSWLMNYGSKA